MSYDAELWESLKSNWDVVRAYLDEQVRVTTDKCLSVQSMEELAKLRGRVEAYRELMNLPDLQLKKRKDG